MLDSMTESRSGAAWNPELEHNMLDRPGRRRPDHRAH
jgi:hypothetical protein